MSRIYYKLQYQHQISITEMYYVNRCCLDDSAHDCIYISLLRIKIIIAVLPFKGLVKTTTDSATCRHKLEPPFILQLKRNPPSFQPPFAVPART